MKFVAGAILVVGLLALIGLTGYAYLADLSPDRTETRIPVTLDAQ